MRYLVTARLKRGKASSLTKVIENRTLGQGSVAVGEYLRDMKAARLLDNQSIQWVETCFCPTPLAEEQPYWQRYFRLIKVQDAHARTRCRDLNGSEPWACISCDCTERLEERLRTRGTSFLAFLKEKFN